MMDQSRGNLERKDYISHLISIANLEGEYYSYGAVQPCTMFWKELVRGADTNPMPDPNNSNSKNSTLNHNPSNRNSASSSVFNPNAGLNSTSNNIQPNHTNTQTNAFKSAQYRNPNATFSILESTPDNPTRPSNINAFPKLRLKLNVPDTLIINEKEAPLIWVYTDVDGYVCKTTNIGFKDFVAKLTSHSSPNELVTVLKKATYTDNFPSGNDVKLLNSRFLHNASPQQLTPKDTVACLQRFIKSSGSKAFFCRTLWRKDKSGQAFIITNKKDMWDEAESEQRRLLVKANATYSHIVRTVQGQDLKKTTQYLAALAHLFESTGSIRMLEMVADFIKDQAGNWWLVNVKAFRSLQKQARPSSAMTPKESTQPLRQSYEKERYQKTKTCRYCQKNYLQSELTHKITIRMLIEMDRYFLHMGQTYKWLKRSDTANVDSHCLYQEHRICQRCYRLYTEMQLLMDTESKFMTKLGVVLDKKPQQLIMALTNTADLEYQSKKKELESLGPSIPSVLQLGPNSRIILREKCPMRDDSAISKMYRYRVLFYFHEIDQVSGLKGRNGILWLQYSVFGVKNRLKIDSSAIEEDRIRARRLKVSYFFAHQQEDVLKYLAQEQQLIVTLILEDRQSGERKSIAKLTLPSKEYLSVKNVKKQFYKFFRVSLETSATYGWGLEGTIQVISSEECIPTSKMIFHTENKLIYLPNDNYYFCEQLPDDWVDMFKELAKKPNRPSLVYTGITEPIQTVERAIFRAIQETPVPQPNWSSLMSDEIKAYEKPITKKARRSPPMK